MLGNPTEATMGSDEKRSGGVVKKMGLGSAKPAGLSSPKPRTRRFRPAVNATGVQTKIWC
jgi:hypothetical protein